MNIEKFKSFDDFDEIKKEVERLERMFNNHKDDDDNETKFKEMFDEYGIDMDQLEKDLDNFAPKKELGYVKTNIEAVDPKYNYITDSGFDLHSVEETTLKPFGRALIPTGLSFDIPDGCEIQVRPKSGLAINQGLTVLNTPGTADCGYTGEIKVIVFNTNPYEVLIPKGMKIAQAVMCPVFNGKWVELVEIGQIKEKDRGSNGFGSTGI